VVSFSALTAPLSEKEIPGSIDLIDLGGLCANVCLDKSSLVQNGSAIPAHLENAVLKFIGFILFSAQLRPFITDQAGLLFIAVL
jgi:hypothetical protein